ncbi:signal peptidase I [Marinobacterium sediminicola]|uniref:Signal peptidase I n=1 Tax=Marinobacterium sediminicola TaxID=518898 RepID=A0ABY1RZX1_9GAMM|nr:signal peptidase I [Marinobacterium sediminicola]ULG69916.1 signal peptidase I [Marinobacterium sediminicola]SMR74365.1 signal peptidase I [Marinobacterium sediminicola]
MNLDFSLILVLVTALTGVLWLLDAAIFAPRRQQALQTAQQQAQEPLPEAQCKALLRQPGWADTSKSMFPVLLFVLLLRSFLYEPFQIPSGSMLPTLKIGDFILVNKYHYGLRLPVLNTRFVANNDPQHGDVIVFRYPEDTSINFIKRVVGVPGDVITYKNKVLYVNGVAQQQELLAKLPPSRPEQLLLKETLAEVPHRIYRDIYRPVIDGEWTVPDGHYFVLGDNRDNSKDSRYWGFVPDELLVGKATAVWMHWDGFFSLPEFSDVRRIN